MRIIIISPIRNEEKYISFTLKSMVEQTILPDKWIIVNDGSNDNSENIIQEFIKNFKFIEYISLPDRGFRKPGQGVVEAFNEGLKRVSFEEFDIISKFDGDLEFSPNTIENIINAFQSDSKLGITGGTRYEKLRKNDEFSKLYVPEGFVGGPFKFYRKECFRDIQGLVPRAGWDGIDIVRARMKGWRTGELPEIKIYHLRSTGTADGEGHKRAFIKDGDINYHMGGYIWYFLLRLILRSFQYKNPQIGYYMIIGYFSAIKNSSERESKEFRKYLRKMQIKNLKNWINLYLKSFK